MHNIGLSGTLEILPHVQLTTAQVTHLLCIHTLVLPIRWQTAWVCQIQRGSQTPHLAFSLKPGTEIHLSFQQNILSHSNPQAMTRHGLLLVYPGRQPLWILACYVEPRVPALPMFWVLTFSFLPLFLGLNLGDLSPGFASALPLHRGWSPISHPSLGYITYTHLLLLLTVSRLPDFPAICSQAPIVRCSLDSHHLILCHIHNYVPGL